MLITCIKSKFVSALLITSFPYSFGHDFRPMNGLLRPYNFIRPVVSLRPRFRWEDNINLDLRETGIDGANWIQLAQDRVQWRAFVNTVMNLRAP
jgi:hypothetical protein